MEVLRRRKKKLYGMIGCHILIIFVLKKIDNQKKKLWWLSLLWKDSTEKPLKGWKWPFVVKEAIPNNRHMKSIAFIYLYPIDQTASTAGQKHVVEERAVPSCNHVTRGASIGCLFWLRPLSSLLGEAINFLPHFPSILTKMHLFFL